MKHPLGQVYLCHGRCLAAEKPQCGRQRTKQQDHFIGHKVLDNKRLPVKQVILGTHSKDEKMPHTQHADNYRGKYTSKCLRNAVWAYPTLGSFPKSSHVAVPRLPLELGCRAQRSNPVAQFNPLNPVGHAGVRGRKQKRNFTSMTRKVICLAS